MGRSHAGVQHLRYVMCSPPSAVAGWQGEARGKTLDTRASKRSAGCSSACRMGDLQFMHACMHVQPGRCPPRHPHAPPTSHAPCTALHPLAFIHKRCWLQASKHGISSGACAHKLEYSRDAIVEHQTRPGRRGTPHTALAGKEGRGAGWACPSGLVVSMLVTIPEQDAHTKRAQTGWGRDGRKTSNVATGCSTLNCLLNGATNVAHPLYTKMRENHSP